MVVVCFWFTDCEEGEDFRGAEDARLPKGPHP